jgi:hypothetical protein
LTISVWILNDRPTTLKNLKVEGPKGKNNRKSKVKNGGVQSFKVPSLGKNVTY